MLLPKFFFVVTSIVLLFVQGTVVGLEQAELTAALDKVIDSDPTARRTTIALKVVDIATGEVLYDRHGDRLFTPASNLKIYTSACALDTFGPEHCFPTQVTATVDDKTHTIHGDLTIIGGGNAMLAGTELKALADRIVDQWKVHTLQGKVVVDNTRYSNTQLGPGWMWDDQSHYFNMRVTPLMVDFNTMAILGSLEKDGRNKRVAIGDPQTHFAIIFSAMLRARNIKIESPQANPSIGTVQSLAHNGTKLAETLRHFNHESENAVGEVLLHEIAVANGIKRPAWPDGAKLITTWLHDAAGLEQGSFKLVDGSGLSRYNLISAASSVKLLAFMRRHKHYPTFFHALPTYEVGTGTGKTQELVRAKSGGMSGVSTISGYAQTLDGRQLAFSLLGNGFIGSSKPVRDLRGKVWRVLVRYQGASGKTAE